MGQKQQWLTSVEAAEYLGIAEVTLRTWRSKQYEAGPPYYKIGRTVKYAVDELDGWVQSRRVSPDRTAA